MFAAVRLSRRRGPLAVQGLLGLAHRHNSTGLPPLFDKILIANRGEIACRVMRTAQRLGVKTVAVYSEADANSMHVTMADEAHLIGPPPVNQSYLRADRVLEIARNTGAQGIHPGYGFLSENEQFARMCEKEGVTFIGPPADAIRAMGSKDESKLIMEAAKVPCVPGYHGEEQNDDFLFEQAKEMGFPVMIKAVKGGGGKGMRIVENENGFLAALQSARRESKASFGDDRVLIERYLRRPRHVEFQIFADTFGNTIHLNERDCSLQRRHQKVIEEAPAPGFTPEMRARMGDSAVAAAKSVGYVGAGTVEFMLDEDDSYYFMEMNTRLQVEHPITEMITGVDLVEFQLRIASGSPLPISQKEVPLNGHAFEGRIYAENPLKNFLPQTGTLSHLRVPPTTDYCRVDTGVNEGDDVSVYYDPMIAKLIVWDIDRESALRRLNVALEQYQVVGLPTNIEFLSSCAKHPEFAKGNVDTSFIPKYHDELMPKIKTPPATSICLDPSSPWGQLHGFRLNTQQTRRIPLRLPEENIAEGEEVAPVREVDVNVTYLPDGEYDIEVHGNKLRCSGELSESSNGDITAVIGHPESGQRLHKATVVVHKDEVVVFDDGQMHTVTIPTPSYTEKTAAKGSLLSPMPGKIVKILVKSGDHVKKGQSLVIMEAMKMEHTIQALADGVVKSVHFEEGEIVEEKKALVTMEVADE